jgi:O-antigen/teichoic acid export membrane protein
MTLIFVKGPQDLLRFPVISFLSALPIITIYLKKLSFKPELLKPNLKRIKSYLSSSLVLWSISLLVQIYNGVDIIIMGVFRPPAEVGCYAIARRAVGGIGLLMVFFAGATLPRLSATFAKDAMEFDQATRKFLRLSVALIIAVVLPLAFFARDIIHFTVGGEYLSAVHPFLILLCGLAIVMFNLPFSTGLIAAGLERDVLKQAFASASVNLISNFILIEKYGMIGASFSFVMAELVALVWILTVYRKRIGSKVILDV